jgi:AcrR family transcriptional regulator
MAIAAEKRLRRRARDFSREEILDAARALFVKESFDAVTIRKIAAEIGCAPGTIYLHFKDKAEIFLRLCEETFSRLGTRMAAIGQDDDDPLECLRRAGRAYIQFGLEHPSHYLITFVHGFKSPMPQKLEAGERCFSNLVRMVARCAEAGQLRNNNVEEISQVLWTSLHGTVSLLITHCNFPFVEQSRLIERQLDVLIEGIRK